MIPARRGTALRQPPEVMTSVERAMHGRRGRRRRVHTRAPMHASYVVRCSSRASTAAGQAVSRRGYGKGIRRASVRAPRICGGRPTGRIERGANEAALLGNRGGRTYDMARATSIMTSSPLFAQLGVRDSCPLQPLRTIQRGGCVPRSSSSSRTNPITRRVSAIMRSTDSR